MIIMVVDVETSTGAIIDPLVDELCELGFVIANYHSKTILTQFSQLYKVNNWSKEAAAIHKIPEDVCQHQGNDPSSIAKLDKLFNFKIDYIIAHNAAYDKTVLSRYWPWISKQNWICSQQDFTHDSINVTSKRLNHIASDYGIIMPGAHRALRDCLVVLEMAYRNDIIKAWARKNEKKYSIEAYGGYQEGIPQKFKENGWKWNPNKKCWYLTAGVSELKSVSEFVKAIGFTPKATEIQPEY